MAKTRKKIKKLKPKKPAKKIGKKKVVKKTAKTISSSGLITIRDFIRYGASRFNEAELYFGHGTTDAFDESAFLVLETLNLPNGATDPYFDSRLTAAETTKVLAIIEKRVKTRKPASYLINKAYIQAIPFYVDERVIVPRSFIAEIMTGDGSPVVGEPETILDLCTGSGCLAILAAHMFPDALVDAVDLSPDALAVAKRNVADHGVQDRVSLHKGDLFAPLKNKKYDLIITNPPYVRDDVMGTLPHEYRHEPAMALAGGGDDGMLITARILNEAAAYLNDDGGIICEIGTGRADLEAAFPDIEFLWLETEGSVGEVFWLTKDQLPS